MKRAYGFIAGGSRITPVGIAVAVASGVLLHARAAQWAGIVYLGLLVITLAAATAEPLE